MTTTNNNREYAIRLYYEVREADNSLNCKTSYKVFDNMQDAVNYAIDFIANNPDANIRLSDEHFDGSQISVYGDSPTKHYYLTDADINAVRSDEAAEDTVFAAYEAAINCDRAYVLKAQELFTARADGDTLRAFQLAYAQDRKQYGENISQALRALGDNRSDGYNEKIQSLLDSWDAVRANVLTVNKTIFNQRLIVALIQKFDENAQANVVKVTEQDNSNVTIESVNPERFSATVYYYRPDENGGEPWHGDKYQQFATAAQAANFIIKFAAEHYDYTITTDSNIRDWDNRKQYWLADADINVLAADAFVKTTRQAAALKDKIARDAEASDSDNVFDLLPDVDDLNDFESEWQYLRGIYAQIKREQGDFTTKIGVATVTELTRAQKIAADIAAMLKGHHCHFVYAENSGGTVDNTPPVASILHAGGDNCGGLQTD